MAMMREVHRSPFNEDEKAEMACVACLTGVADCGGRRFRFHLVPENVGSERCRSK